MSFTIEEERGTFTGTPRQHNGYYAGDFSQVRMRTAPELAILTKMQRPVTRTHPQH